MDLGENPRKVQVPLVHFTLIRGGERKNPPNVRIYNRKEILNPG
jgi:hypothetical protein